MSAGFVLADMAHYENSISLPRCSSVTTIVLRTKATFSALPHGTVIGRISTRTTERMIAKKQEYVVGGQIYSCADMYDQNSRRKYSRRSSKYLENSTLLALYLCFVYWLTKRSDH